MKRMDALSARREPAWQGYHTGSPAAGREYAARAMCSSEKDVFGAYQVACVFQETYEASAL